MLVFLANTLRISLQVNLPILPVLRWAAVVEISQVAQPADRARAGLRLRPMPISNWHTLSTLTDANNLQHGSIILRCYRNLRLIEIFWKTILVIVFCKLDFVKKKWFVQNDQSYDMSLHCVWYVRYVTVYHTLLRFFTSIRR